METVEILHYKWCIALKGTWDDNFIYSKSLSQDTLVYCKVEKYYELEDPAKGGICEQVRNESCGIRTVPVKREDMEKI